MEGEVSLGQKKEEAVEQKIATVRKKIEEYIEDLKKVVRIALLDETKEAAIEAAKELEAAKETKFIEEIKERLNRAADIFEKAIKETLEEHYKARTSIAIDVNDRIRIVISFYELYLKEHIDDFIERVSSIIARYFYNENKQLYIDEEKIIKSFFRDEIKGHSLDDTELSYKIGIYSMRARHYMSDKVVIDVSVFRNNKGIAYEEEKFDTTEDQLEKEEYERYKKVRKAIEALLSCRSVKLYLEATLLNKKRYIVEDLRELAKKL